MGRSRADRADERAEAWVRIMAHAIEQTAPELTREAAFLYSAGIVAGVAAARPDLADAAARRSDVIERVVEHMESERALVDGSPPDEPAEVAHGTELWVDPDDELADPTDRELVDLDELPDPASV